jgi:hypothetical protein
LGDSHIRSFSYCPYFIPIFIGPSAFNNFLTKKNEVSVKEKCFSILDKIPTESIIITCFSGDSEHHSRPLKNLKNVSKEIFPKRDLISSSAQRHVEFIKELRSYKNHDVISISPIPGTYTAHCTAHSIYTKYFNELCKNYKIRTLCINHIIAPKG